MPRHETLTGKGLAAARKEAGLSQSQLAKRAYIGRHAVSYWETSDHVDPSAYAVRLMAVILGIDLKAYELPSRKTAAVADLEPGAPPQPARCGARNRRGFSCAMKPEPGKHRCKFHGGRSTGPKTDEGRQRIAEAQRRRWSRYQMARMGS
ncbi:HGGxSTG domain-containing protein [Shinella sp.]|jgi:transcriptional regulator with XRE-family HTH domain|uniref:HGGxSTG domain-containing protein n=1 Tax=Shinella sp. TaxID=1870904 RepID=UPI0039C95A80